MQKENNENNYKILLLGNIFVGKSSILIKYSDDYFPENYIATVGLDYRLKHFDLPNGQKGKIQIWDTAGQDRFKSITKNYYNNSNGIILVYSVIDKKSFDDISNWIDEIKEQTKDDIIIFLVGNKIDLNEKRVISIKEGEKLAENYHINYYETSAKTGKGIDKIFNDLIKQIYDKYSNNNIKDDNDVKKKKGIFNILNSKENKHDSKNNKNNKDKGNVKNKKKKCC